MSVNIWYTSSRVWSPITVLWNLRRKCCFLWPFSSRKSCLGAVSASVSLTVPLYVYVATNGFWFIRHLRGLRSVENVSWDGSSASTLWRSASSPLHTALHDTLTKHCVGTSGSAAWQRKEIEISLSIHCRLSQPVVALKRNPPLKWTLSRTDNRLSFDFMSNSRKE